MKKQTRWLCVLAVCGVLAGCGKKIPGDVIRPEAMENLLYDYHLASTLSASLPYDENYKKEAYVDYVFQKHGVTEAEFDSSMVWYTRHAEELASIYRRLQERFEKDEKQMKHQVTLRDNQIDVSMSGDTVDVWQNRSLAWLSASPLTNKLTFDLKTDTTFKPRDAMELKADFHFLPDKHAAGKAVMSLSFHFDNDSVQGLTRTVARSGEQRLLVKPDSAFAIQNISGFIYYIGEEGSHASLLVSDIHLTRYHQEEVQAMPADTLRQEPLDSVRMTQERDSLLTVKRDTTKRNISREGLQPMRRMENRKR